LANPELGAKQICPNCQAKFYDLNKRPAHCPKCDTEFDPEEVVRNRRVRTRTAMPDYEDAEEKAAPEPAEDGFEEEADETPEIDQAIEGEAPEADEDEEEGAPGAPASGGEDLGVDFAEDEDLAEDEEDVPFLEDDDDDGFPEDEIDGLPDEDDRDS
jgi:uncharacterized protein (TIGR02300 family)